MRCRYNAVNVNPNPHKRHGMSFVSSACPTLSSGPVATVRYMISCFIRPRYNGTRLYSTEQSSLMLFCVRSNKRLNKMPNIEAGTKWTMFQTAFSNTTYTFLIETFAFWFEFYRSRILIWSLLKFVPVDPFENKTKLVLGKGLAPNKRKAILWTNDDLFPSGIL